MGHIAHIVFAVIHAVGDHKNDVAGLVVLREIFQRIVECRGGSATSVGHQRFKFALQFIVVVAFKGNLQPCAEIVLVQMAEYA